MAWLGTGMPTLTKPETALLSSLHLAHGGVTPLSPPSQILLLLGTLMISKLMIGCNFGPPYEVYLKVFLSFLSF